METLEIYNAQVSLQGLTNNVRITLSVADTQHVVYNWGCICLGGVIGGAYFSWKEKQILRSMPKELIMYMEFATKFEAVHLGLHIVAL